MNPWFNVCFAAGMICAPVLFLALWCHWTGVSGLLRVLLATLGLLVAFGVGTWIVQPAAFHPWYWAWGTVGLWVGILGFGVPFIRRAFRALPEAPRAASLKTRRVDLPRAAWTWPFVAWAVVTALVLVRGGFLAWLGPVLGLGALVLLRWLLPRSVLEPEPLGGADPEGLERRYARFRRRRVRGMYWLMVVLALVVTGAGRLMAFEPGWAGAALGSGIGVWGALFGTWADAQRYLLRLQLSGAAPPA